MQNKSKNKLFYQFLVSYVLVLIIPLFIGLLAYAEIVKTVKNETFEKNLSLLKQVSKTVDENFKQIEKNVQVLSMSSHFSNLSMNALHNRTSAAIYLDKWKISEHLRLFRMMNTNIIDFLVYPRNCSFVVTINGSYEISNFYSHSFQYSSMGRKEWDNLIKMNNMSKDFYPSNRMFYFGEYYEVIPYIRPIYATSESSSCGTIVTLINSGFLKDMLKSLDLGKDGFVKVIDSYGNPIMTLHGDEFTNDTDFAVSGIFQKNIMIESSIKSNITNWTYSVYVPSKYVLRNIYYVKILITFFVLISLLVGFLAAYWFAYSKNKPLKDIFVLTRQNDTCNSNNALEIVKDSFNNLITDNNVLKNRINEQIPIIKAVFMDRLIKGTYSTEKEIELLLAQVNISIKGRYFNVVVLKFAYAENATLNSDVISKLSLVKISLDKFLPDIQNGRFFTHYMNEDKIILVCCYEYNDYKLCKKEAEQFANDVLVIGERETGIDGIASIGNMYTNLSEISRSYEEALLALDGFNIGKKIVWFDDLPNANSVYYFPVNIEIRLIQLAKQGDAIEVNKILKEIYYENFFKRKLTPDMNRYLIKELAGTLIKIIGSEEYDENLIEFLNNYERKYSLEHSYERIVEFFESECEKISNEKMFNKRELIKSIISYIDVNFTDSSMYLGDISVQFNISESYLSILFKEITGDTFSNYLESKRINYACEILKDKKNIKITEIPFMVGYTNDSTFRKAFKRVLGVNPKSYKC